MKATVTALLVSHDGARWLPAVLDGVAGQSRRPDRVVAVDTGSTDASVELLGERLGPDAVHSAPPRTSYGAAVAKGLAALPPADDADDSDDSEWVWLLHDDSAPTPQALEVLLAAAEANPGIDVLGPKLREWPSLRRLLEVGVTISGTGRRETGLERGEYDQGQHDDVHDVLAVNTAGMLVRRSLLEALGFDQRLPLFGNDIDFGWRAARAGHRTLAVPDAVVFHVEAAHRGVRRTELSGKHFRRGERQAAIYTLLVNGSAAWLPFQAVRLLLGSLIRALGFLLVRSPGEAFDELVALARVYSHPLRIVSGRRRRRATAELSHREVRHLLAPPWLPYRHGLDFVGDIATAVAHQATDMSAARRSRLADTETGPVPAEAQNLPEDNGLVARAVTNPAVGGMVLLVVAAVVAARGLVGSGMLAGGALLPAPGSALDWWRTYLESGHDLGVGSAAPAAPYLLPLAALGSLLVAKAWLVIDLVFLLAVPLAAFGGYRFLLRSTGSRPAALWGGAAYGLLPVVTGAVQEGRLGTVAASLVLPWLAHAALFLAPGHSQDRRWRAAWRTTLWLALLVAFAPLGLVLAVPVTLVVLVAGRVGGDKDTWSRTGTWLPVVTPVVMTLVLLLPWTLLVWAHQGPSAWFFEAGLPAPRLAAPLSWLDVVFGRPGAAGAPWWLGLGVVLAGLGALARPDRRRLVLRSWLVLVVALVVTAVLSGVAVAPAASGLPQPIWLGLPLLVAQAAAISAAATAGAGVRSRLTGNSFGWRQPVGAALVVVALLTPVAGVAWWVGAGSDEPLDRGWASSVPTYMSDAATADPTRGVLVLRGDRARGFDHLLVRGTGLRTGDESVLPTTEEQQPLTDLVSDLVTAPDPEDVDRLASFGVGFIYAPAPVDGRLAGNLDTLSGVTPGSATSRGARAWQVQVTATEQSPVAEPSSLRPWLLGLQGLAIVVAAVLAAPTRTVTR
ncbi:MAG: glycosyltransferase [Nocardioides sp.]